MPELTEDERRIVEWLRAGNRARSFSLLHRIELAFLLLISPARFLVWTRSYLASQIEQGEHRKERPDHE